MEGHQRPADESVEDVFLQHDLSPTIAEHAAECQSLFHKSMIMTDIVPDPTIMDDQMARFSLWTSNIDVFGPLNVSLDYRLRFSPTATDIIHQLLDIICDTLLSLKPVADQPPRIPNSKRQRISVHGDSGDTRRFNDNASDSESDVDPEDENISKITETIGGTLTRLFRLSNAVRKSAKANRAHKIETYRNDEEANKAIEELRVYTKCYIDFRFPEAPKALQSALVEANALRLRRMYYQRAHRRRMDLSIHSPGKIPVVAQIPAAKNNVPAVRFEPSSLSKPATSNQMPTVSPAPATNATTARQTAVAALYARSTTDMPRAKSVLVNNMLSFPPIPGSQQCPYCGVIIEFKNAAKSLLWQNHVIADLEPFICFFPHCLEGGNGQKSGPLTFETSKAWTSHMQTAHGHTWECRAPSHNPIVFEQEIQYQEHTIKEHGVPEAHAGTLSNAARRPVLDKVLECPFGDDFESTGKAESGTVFSSEALQSHIAGHMKEIALLSLQKLPGDDDDNVDDIASDQPLEDDEPTGAFWNTRASMYSVLDAEDLDFHDDDGDAADGNMGHREDDISARVTTLDLEDKYDPTISSLRHALQAGDLGLVESLIQRGANITLRDENGQTVLHYAAENGFTESIELLLRHGADLDIVDNFGFSPFLWAVVAGQEGFIARLLFMGADIHSSSAHGESALTWAANLGWPSNVRLLIEHGFNMTDSRNIQQTLPLQEAAAYGHFPTVRWLLDMGADPNYRDGSGWSAIHWAAEEGHLQIVHLLLEAMADPDAVSSYGTSPLHCAANGGHVSIVRLLLQHADPLKSTCHGWTALHHAAFMGHSHVLQCLLEDDRVRSTASQQDNHGWSVLHLAVQSRDLSTIRVLLDKSVIAETQILVDEGGLTAGEWLDRGPTSHSQKAASTLAFSKSRCCRAVTSLRRAVIIGNIPMIKVLLNLGHDINGMNSGRRTALYYAAKERMLLIMDQLLEMGADPNIIPMGRKSWEEFISSDEVILRLKRAGYRKRDTLPEVERQIRQILGVQTQSTMPDHSWLKSTTSTSSVLDQSVSHGSGQPPGSISASSKPRSDHAASSKAPTSLAPASQSHNNKRKLSPGRLDRFRRFIGGA